MIINQVGIKLPAPLRVWVMSVPSPGVADKTTEAADFSVLSPAD